MNFIFNITKNLKYLITIIFLVNISSILMQNLMI